MQVAKKLIKSHPSFPAILSRLKLALQTLSQLKMETGKERVDKTTQANKI